jgi:hypothetical protein
LVLKIGNYSVERNSDTEGISTMPYAVIESTPGYLPEDDEPAVFDQFNEALNYLNELREDLFQEEWAYEYISGEAFFMLDVGEIDGEPPYKGFVYYDKRKVHDLGRVVEIVPSMEEL